MWLYRTGWPRSVEAHAASLVDQAHVALPGSAPDAKVCYWYTGCVGHMVLDSSALVTLAGADALPLLALSAHKSLTVSEVYRETVEVGLAKAYPDAVAIAGLFEHGTVTIQDPRRKEKLAGISRTDSLVLLLAQEVAAAALLVNDQVLLRKAEQRGLAAQFSAEFVQELYHTGRISRRRRDRVFRDFVTNERYTEEFVEALLLRR